MIKTIATGLMVPMFLTAFASGGVKEEIAGLERELPELMKRAQIPGLAIAVIEKGEVAWTGVFGVKKNGGQDAVDPNTVFEAASLSKPMFAYTCLRLVDRGLLDLDKPLADYLLNPGMSHEPRYRCITPRMVLSHRSGLPNTHRAVALDFDPGTSMGYSGLGYVFLNQVIEKITGKSLDVLAREEVFGPLNMKRSDFVWRQTYAKDKVHGHGYYGQPFPAKQQRTADPKGSLQTTPGDYAQFVIAVMQGKGLSEKTSLEMWRSHGTAVGINSGKPVNDLAWGLGWGLQLRTTGPLFWHWGDNEDTQAFVMGDRRIGRAVVYFANSSNGLLIEEAVLGRFFSRPHRWLVMVDFYAPIDTPGMQELLAMWSQSEPSWPLEW